ERRREGRRKGEEGEREKRREKERKKGEGGRQGERGRGELGCIGLDGVRRLRAQAPELEILVVDRAHCGVDIQLEIAPAMAAASRIGERNQHRAGGVALTNEEHLRLTPRQLEVLQLISEGHSTKLIARALDISESTVKVHTRAIFRELGVDNRTQAARKAHIVSGRRNGEPAVSSLSVPDRAWASQGDSKNEVTPGFRALTGSMPG
ncbi:MAG: response regulator transcription factor, partial [Gammaproteobacteria bacterium]